MFGCNTFAGAAFAMTCKPLRELPPPPGPLERRVARGTLGCGVYDVFVTTRGGGRLVADIPQTQVTWGRVLDDTSAATVTAAQIDPACAAALGTLRPWRHELALYRDGDHVWAGPITGISLDDTGLVVNARDLTAWWDHRLIHDDHQYVEPIDLASVFEALNDDAMAPDNTPGVYVKTSRCGVKATFEVLAAQYQVAGFQLRDLASSAVDWTTVGRSILAGGLVVPTKPLTTLRDDHFLGRPKVSFDGTVQANRRVVSGGGSGASGEAVAADAKDTYAIRDDGLLEIAESLSTVSDQAGAQAAAKSRLALGASVVLIENAVLSPDAPILVSDLVPGALCPLRLDQTDIKVSDTYRLQQVSVAADAGGERVTAVFQPRGTA